MPLNMTPEEKEVGKDNFARATADLTRRGFLKTALGGAVALPIAAAAYFGYNYKDMENKPVKAGLIGAGDEGGVLLGEHNPQYLEFVAYSDIRPSNQKRIFEDEKLKNPNSPRRGFKFHYGNDAPKKIKLYENYQDLLADKDIEAVVIALPLHLHARVSIQAMEAGKHVLCEKLMAWNINQCKKMIEVGEKQNRILTIGHQRHYSTLYAQALATVHAGVLGEIKHIRALWHRNNTWPKIDSKTGRPKGEKVANWEHIGDWLRDSWCPELKDEDVKALEAELKSKYDYKDMKELVRWRLYNRTGGGLMAELGSHQLDACSIFLGKVQPLAVSAVGTKAFYEDGRDVDDHVFCTFEFPGPNYWQDPRNPVKGTEKDRDDKVVVTYSSINTNGFEPYGECLMGTRGTMIVESEQQVYLYGERDPNAGAGGPSRSTTMRVVDGGGKPALDSSSSTGPAYGGKVESAAADGGPVSRGYREEMEHFAYCVRMWQKAEGDKNEQQKWRLTPRCHGKVAMADAIIALTSNLAMRRGQRIEFDPEWFKPETNAVPDAEMKALDAAAKEIEY